MIGDRQKRVLQVDHVTGNVEVGDLPSSLASEFVAQRDACDHQTAMAGLVALPHGAPGLGLNLIQAVAENQLGGTAILAFDPEGLTATFSLPIQATRT